PGDAPRTGRTPSGTSSRGRDLQAPACIAYAPTPLVTSANAASSLGEYEPAAEALMRAIAILERAYGPEHQHPGIELTDLAWIRMMQGRLDEARALADRGGTIFEKSDPDSPNVHNSLAMRADIYARRGELDEALAERSHASQSRIDGPEERMDGP